MKRTIALSCALLFAVAVPFAGARARTASSRPSGLDKSYLKTSMEGDLFEVQGGKLAEGRSHNKAVLRLARRLVSDHSKSYNDAATLARKLGVQVPTSPSPSQQWELQAVGRLHGKAFNHWYSKLEVLDHEQDIQETTDEVKDGRDAEVVKDARKELPMLREHLRLARAALKASH